VEERVASTPVDAKPSRQKNWAGDRDIVALSDVTSDDDQRFTSGIHELDRILGGGFVTGSLVLVGGDPGIGKSTLLLQVSHLSRLKGKVLYVSGEESKMQIRMRAQRLNADTDHITLCTQTSFESVAETIQTIKPALCVIDSIQTLYTEEISSAPGSISQVREVTAGLLRLAKSLMITIVLVGHVTKDGTLAGPRILEHMVDTVLYFEGEGSSPYRMLRAVKNRYGATGELAFFEMTQEGLTGVESASTLLLSGRPISVPGSVITACLEGTQSVLVEIQALLNPSNYSVPQRMAQGLDRGRIGMLLAVLEKKFSVGINNMDAYINVVGGLRLTETACDLAVLAAVFSAMRDRPVRSSTLVLGEVGLTGEIRPVSHIEKRLSEAVRLGFNVAVLPGGNKDGIDRIRKRSKKSGNKNTNDVDDRFPECIYADTISEAMDVLFESGKGK
jgi:DNA repair protein RadA/Sms